MLYEELSRNQYNTKVVRSRNVHVANGGVPAFRRVFGIRRSQD